MKKFTEKISKYFVGIFIIALIFTCSASFILSRLDTKTTDIETPKNNVLEDNTFETEILKKK